jgi:oxygen-dependent protoporphyrinogen oxidase
MTRPRVVVAGAGITGLAAAFSLRLEAARRGRGIDLVVVDAGDAPGGHARTICEDGFLVERGPNGFLDRGADTMALIAELDLGPRLVEANPAARRRFILQDGRLQQVPESPPALIASKALGWRAKLRLLSEPWAAAPPRDTDETVFEFAERRLGRDAAETFVDTAVAGISGGDSRELSVRSQFPVLKEWEREHGSLLKAMLRRKSTGRPRLLSFDRGLGVLTTTLADRLNGAIRTNARIGRIERAVSGWQVHLTSGSTLVADHVVCALPSHAAARVAHGFDRELASSLASIPYAGLSVVALAYRASAIERPLDGYGYLVTRAENLSTLGVLCESAIFPNRAPEGSVLLRVMLGGARHPEVATMDDESVTALAIHEASTVLGIVGRPLRQWVCRWPSAIAQYTVGHDTRTSAINTLAAAHPGLHFCGTAYDGVSFNDAIASARRAAKQVAAGLDVPLRHDYGVPA